MIQSKPSSLPPPEAHPLPVATSSAQHSVVQISASGSAIVPPSNNRTSSQALADQDDVLPVRSASVLKLLVATQEYLKQDQSQTENSENKTTKNGDCFYGTIWAYSIKLMLSLVLVLVTLVSLSLTWYLVGCSPSELLIDGRDFYFYYTLCWLPMVYFYGDLVWNVNGCLSKSMNSCTEYLGCLVGACLMDVAWLVAVVGWCLPPWLVMGKF